MINVDIINSILLTIINFKIYNIEYEINYIIISKDINMK